MSSSLLSKNSAKATGKPLDAVREAASNGDVAADVVVPLKLGGRHGW